MRCKICVEQGLKSTFYPGTAHSTLLGGDFNYYDSDGNYHMHDPNTITQEFSCSNGHRYLESRKQKCPTCYTEISGV